MSSSAHRAGFVALIGSPNVGKSTLLNNLLDFKLSIVSKKEQTTRHKILGILNGKDYQICFLDTPGWLKHAADRLQEALIRATQSAVRKDIDVIVLLVEPSIPAAEDLAHLAKLASVGKPVILAVNKSDRLKDHKKLEAVADACRKALPAVATCFISALKGSGVKGLLNAILRRLPESPPYYEKGRLSDRWERFFVCEIIRQTLFELYHEEIPHACAVAIEEFKEKKGKKDRISAIIHPERAAQKAIVIGKKGRAIRELKEKSLAAIEKFLGRKAELELWVKVRPGWRRDNRALKDLGY